MQLIGKRAKTIATTAIAGAGLLALAACGQNGTTTANSQSAVASTSVEKTVRVTYSCTGIPGIEDIDVTIAAPATATRGQTVTLEVSAVKLKALPFESPADSIRVKLDIALSGASTGQVTATGLRNLATPANQPVPLVGGKVQVKLHDAGEVTFTPRNLHSPVAQCLVQGTPPAAVTTRVVDA